MSCPICLSVIEVVSNVVWRWPCAHAAHLECLAPSIATLPSLPRVCPTCRTRDDRSAQLRFRSACQSRGIQIAGSLQRWSGPGATDITYQLPPSPTTVAPQCCSGLELVGGSFQETGVRSMVWFSVMLPESTVDDQVFEGQYKCLACDAVVPCCMLPQVDSPPRCRVHPVRTIVVNIQDSSAYWSCAIVLDEHSTPIPIDCDVTGQMEFQWASYGGPLYESSDRQRRATKDTGGAISSDGRRYQRR